MDATARLLAPRKLTHRPEGEGRREKKLPGKEQKPEKPNRKERRGGEKQPQAPSPVPQGGRKKRGRSGRPPEVTLRSNGQKDSTEQPSLMKPYYLSDD